MGDVEKSLSVLSLGLEEDEELPLQEEDSALTDMTSDEAMENGDAEDVPLEHSEGSKRQRLHLNSFTVSSNIDDSNKDISTLEAGLANQARRHQ
ncbi:hypothetical protein V6N13_104285 [Hibiscus sabdariffa]|uniref:Uncharacterized protein n=2 Tax=Hibiscus sabdariffa TaxID=183260 RepID=A0ABR1ZW62_9ROSI